MRHRAWDVDIDIWLNRVVPSPPWARLPYPLAHFLGHRKATPPPPPGNVVVIFWAFFGILSSILLIEAATSRVPLFAERRAPIIVGSFGAAAVLEFYAIESPLAQPRNAILGQAVASIVGVAVAKLFQLSDSFDDLRWVAGALACASATALMGLTKTVHPPAGATALLAVVNADLVAIGWLLIPVVMLGCALMLVVALVVNNLERRFPLYWWTPQPLRPPRRPDDEEKPNDARGPDTADKDPDAADKDPDTDSAPDAGGAVVLVRRGQVIVPRHLSLTNAELQLLEAVSCRL